MAFLAPGWLLLSFLAGPLLLLHARRRRRVEVPSVRLWTRLAPTAARRPHLGWPRLSPILLLQVAVLLLVSLSLAQPRMGAKEAAPDHTIFLLDVSGSMGARDVAPDRFSLAAAEFEQRALRLAEEGGRVSLIAVGALPRIVAARQAEPEAIRAVSPPRREDGAADWSGALALVPKLMREGEESRLVLLTDAEGGAGPAAAEEQFGTGRVEARIFGTSEVGNAALQAQLTPLAPASGQWRVEGSVTTLAGADSPDFVDLRFGPEGDAGDLDWGRIALHPVAAGAEGAAEVRTFGSVLSFPGGGRLSLSIGPDAVPHDDRLHFVLEANPRAIQILKVGPENEQILRALAALGEVEIGFSNELPADAARFDLVVVNDVTVPHRPATNTLWLARAHVEGEPAPAPSVPGRVTAWRPDHPLSRHVDWSALDLVRLFPGAGPAGGEVVVESAGIPLVEARTTRHGREVRLAFDPAASGWSHEPGFPAFFAALAGWIGIEPGTVVVPTCFAGEMCNLPARESTARIIGPDGAVVRDAALASPEYLAEGAGEGFVPVQAGFYRIERAGLGRWIAVNPRSGAVPEPFAANMASDWRPEPRWWWWLLAGAGVLLVVEGWLAGRGTERFLVPAALRRSAPQASRRRFLLGLRLGALALVAGGLLSAPMPTRAPGESRVLVADASDGETWQRLAKNSDAGIVFAGPQAVLAADVAERGVAPGPTLVDVEGFGVDLEAALRLAGAMLPPHRPGRVVVATPGAGTLGQAGRAAETLQARGVAIDLVRGAVAAPGGGGVLVDRVIVPPKVHTGESFAVNALIHSGRARSVQVAVLRDGEAALVETVELSAGFNRIEASLLAGDAGPMLVEVTVRDEEGVLSGNDREGAVVQVGASPSILLVTPEAEAGERFAEALAAQGLPVRVASPREAPLHLERWIEHDLVILMNMPALSMSIAQMEVLEEAVTRHGLGLLILGGENAFGPGGYYMTPLEDMSPLSSNVPHDAPVAALVFVLDRSGSMQARITRTMEATRMDIAKAAITNAVELLNDESRVGIVAFDDDAYVVLPLLDRKDHAAVAAALEPVAPGGGTALMPGLVRAIPMLEEASAEMRHVIVMTDGLIEAVDFTAIMEQAAKAGISVSAIAVGVTVVTDRLENVAQMGVGAYYTTRDFRALPSIMAQETFRMSGSPFRLGERPVLWADRSAPFLEGMPARMPPLASHVGTTLKPGAVLHMALPGEGGELVPLLGSWRHGNGRVTAFAAHAAGHGTQFWQDMAEYPLLWAQIARHSLRAGMGPGMHVSVGRSADEAVVAVTLLDFRGETVAGQEVTAAFADESAIALSEIGPGRFEGRLPIPGPGTHKIEVHAGAERAEAAIHAGYSAAFNPVRSGQETLVALTAMTGGRVLEPGEDPFVTTSAWVLRAAWMPWVLAGLSLFAAELLLRYGADHFAFLRRGGGKAGGAEARDIETDGEEPRVRRRA